MFYSENKFEFSRNFVFGLEYVWKLGPLAWASFRNIAFALDDTYHDYDGSYSANTREPIFLECPVGPGGELKDWTDICELLATHNTLDDSLKLRCICVARTKETAAAFLAALDNLPRLKELAIQMGPFWNPGIYEMVKSKIREKTASKPERSLQQFPFFDLPVELQYRILEHTDLIAPMRLIYSPERDTFIPDRELDGGCERDTFSQNPRKDYCHGRAVLACWRTPHMLFLVSKRMQQLAIGIYYSKNIFHVRCEPKLSPPAASWSARKSIFLRCFPQRSLQHLQRIRFKLPVMRNWAVFWPEFNEAEDWAISLYLLSLIAHPKLTIELLMVYNWSRNPTSETQDLSAYDNDFCSRVVTPMGCLKGRLQDLFIYIRSPLNSSCILQYVKKERELEQSIMGTDYESLARGKAEAISRYSGKYSTLEHGEQLDS
ncbi:hypothetical protein BDV06DRAFT_197798 [Aspergillus oleicola]